MTLAQHLGHIGSAPGACWVSAPGNIMMHLGVSGTRSAGHAEDEPARQQWSVTCYQKTAGTSCKPGQQKSLAMHTRLVVMRALWSAEAVLDQLVSQ